MIFVIVVQEFPGAQPIAPAHSPPRTPQSKLTMSQQMLQLTFIELSQDLQCTQYGEQQKAVHGKLHPNSILNWSRTDFVQRPFVGAEKVFFLEPY